MPPTATDRVVLCMKWGTKYGPEYVNRLYAMVARHLQGPFRFVCLTDNSMGVRPDVECMALPQLDLVLLMSVNPGFGGQAFIPSALDKIRAVRERIDASGRPVRLEVDGGIKVDNIGAVAAAGADTFVAGSAIFGSRDYAATVRAMRSAIDAAG